MPQYRNRQLKFHKNFKISETGDKKKLLCLKIYNLCNRKGGCLNKDIEERIVDERSQSRHRTPELIKALRKKPRFIKDFVTIGKMIASITKKGLFNHWYAVGEFKIFSNQGSFCYFNYFKDSKLHPADKLDTEDRNFIIDCIKYFEKHNHLYKLFAPNYTVARVLKLMDMRSTMPLLDQEYVSIQKNLARSRIRIYNYSH